MSDKHPQDPFARFHEVFEAAVATGIDEPNAMTLCSVDEHGRPASRTVLLKHFDEGGFVFYTNFESRKGRQILANPNVALHFFWRELAQQIEIEGTAESVSDEEADAYFASRDRGSRLGAWASRQSRPLKNRAELLAAVARYELKYPFEVPRPPHWSGLRVVPRYFEFWVKGMFRLHDRTAYERTEDGWTTRKLYP